MEKLCDFISVTFRVTCLAGFLLTSVAHPNPAPGTPGNSGNQNPHGSPPGQGGATPGNSGSNNPHGSPPGQRLPGGGETGVIPGSTSAGSVPATPANGASPGHSSAPTIIPLPDASTVGALPVTPTADAVLRLLAPDGPNSSLEPASVVTVNRIVISPNGASDRSSYRLTRVAGSSRTDLLTPTKWSSLIDNQGSVWQWQTGGWAKLPMAMPSGTTVTASTAFPTAGISPPTVSWLSPPSIVRLRITLPGGLEQDELVDVSKRLQVGRTLWSAEHQKILDEQWHERRWRGQRWLLSRTISNFAAPAIITEIYEWEWPGLAKGLERLRRAP